MSQETQGSVDGDIELLGSSHFMCLSHAGTHGSSEEGELKVSPWAAKVGRGCQPD